MSDTDARLRYASALSTMSGTPRLIAEAYPGYQCYKDWFGGHYWIQRYNDDGSVWLLAGRDSPLPGLDVPSVDPKTLTVCDCGSWMPATKEQAAESRRMSDAVFSQTYGIPAKN